VVHVRLVSLLLHAVVHVANIPRHNQALKTLQTLHTRRVVRGKTSCRLCLLLALPQVSFSFRGFLPCVLQSHFVAVLLVGLGLLSRSCCCFYTSPCICVAVCVGVGVGAGAGADAMGQEESEEHEEHEEHEALDDGPISVLLLAAELLER